MAVGLGNIFGVESDGGRRTQVGNPPRKDYDSIDVRQSRCWGKACKKPYEATNSRIR